MPFVSWIFRHAPGVVATAALSVASAYALPAPGPADLDQISVGNAVYALNGPWRVQLGDSPIDPSTNAPLWAAADFDDSGWGTMSLAPGHPGIETYNRTYEPVLFPGHPLASSVDSGWAWYRLRLRVNAARDVPLALMGPRLVEDAYQLYVNGRLAGSFGKFAPGKKPTGFFPFPKLFELAPAQSGSRDVVLVFRVWLGAGPPDPSQGGMRSAPLLGNAASIAAIWRLTWMEHIRYLSAPALDAAFSLLLAIFVIGMSFFDRSDRVYLWAATAFLMTVTFTAGASVYYLTDLLSGRLTWIAFDGFFLPLHIGMWTMIWWVWFDLRKARWIPGAIAAVIVAAMACVFGQLLAAPGAGEVLSSAWIPVRLAGVALLVVVILMAIRARGLEGWIAAPSVIPLVWEQFVSELEKFGVPPGWNLWGVEVWSGIVGDLLLIGALALLLFRRLLKSVRRQRQVALDLKQAQEVQQVLIPEDIPKIAGFRIEAVYHPAAEVGGDFFQILKTAAGGVLICVGDVSGKGLPAAMTVSLLVGAFRSLAQFQDSPAQVLASMNARMMGRSRGGFTTCLVLRIDPDGRLTAANAGHIAPYVNGEEMALEGGLPLGLASDSSYPETTLPLALHQQLTLITDGVVEARNSSGELLGFDRLASMAASPAQAIATEARNFGQEDDITVVTVVRAESWEPLTDADDTSSVAWRPEKLAKPAVLGPA